jgi:hypothetical protein
VHPCGDPVRGFDSLGKELEIQDEGRDVEARTGVYPTEKEGSVVTEAHLLSLKDMPLGLKDTPLRLRGASFGP